MQVGADENIIKSTNTKPPDKHINKSIEEETD